MILPIDLRFLIASYLNTNILVKLDSIYLNSRFWLPIVNDIKMLERVNDENIIQCGKISTIIDYEVLQLQRGKIHNSMVTIFTRLIDIYHSIPIEFNDIFNNVLVVSNINNRTLGPNFYSKVAKRGFCSLYLNYIVIIIANHPISTNEISSVRSYSKQLPQIMSNEPRVSRFVDYLVNR